MSKHGARFSPSELFKLGPDARRQAEEQLGLRPTVKPALLEVEAKTTAIRQKTRPLNKTEQLFWDYLSAAYPDCIRLSQAVNLDLANGDRYRPDFFVIRQFPNTDPATKAETPMLSRVYAYETKARTKAGKMIAEDDAKTKLKVAATSYRWIQFFIVMKDQTKPSGFRVERVLP